MIDYRGRACDNWKVVVADNAHYSRYLNTSLGMLQMLVAGQGNQITFCMVCSDDPYEDEIVDRVYVGYRQHVELRFGSNGSVVVEVMPVKTLADLCYKNPNTWTRVIG